VLYVMDCCISLGPTAMITKRKGAAEPPARQVKRCLGGGGGMDSCGSGRTLPAPARGNRASRVPPGRASSDDLQ
jgi:hypothetical protein